MTTSDPAQPASKEPAPDGQDELIAFTRKTLDDAIEELRGEANVSRVTKALTHGVMLVLKRRGNYDVVVDDLDRIAEDLDATSATLRRCVGAVREEENRAAKRNPGSAAWWNTNRRRVDRALKEDRPKEARNRWISLWVDGLAMGDWAGCREWLSLNGFPMVEQTRARMRAVTDSLEEGRYTAALDPLDGLLDSGDGLDVDAAVRLGVLRVRILASEFSDPDVIRDAADANIARAGDSAWRGLALAALAETQLATGDIDAARDTLDRARETDTTTIDVLVASGLLHEREGLWSSADRCYDDAVGIDRAAAIKPVLLRPVPAHLFARAALSSGLPATEAVRLLDRALDQGRSDDDTWKRDVQHSLAETLEQLAQDEDDRDSAAKHRSRAAQLYMESGQQFLWSGLTPRAVELFERACELAPDVAEFCWNHAEGLRLNAWRPDNTVDIEVLTTAREQVEHGLRSRLPDDDESWVLITQALIEENLPEAKHDPALLVERALLRDPSLARTYGFLAEVLRRQGFLHEAFEVSEDGRNTADASDPVLFDAHLSLLLDLGRYSDALELVEYQSLRQPDLNVAWYQAVVLLHQGQPGDALAALPSEGLTDLMRELRGLCLFADGDVEDSRDEYRSLWKDARSGPNSGIAGWAAFRAGLLDRAIEIYRDLHRQAPAWIPYTRDLGQMKLVCGDVAEGTSLLEQGISACPFRSDLMFLRAVEFDFVRHKTADEPHGAEVGTVLAALGELIDERCAQLLRARRAVGSVPAQLSAARRAMHTDRPLDALARLLKLIGHEDVPEAVAAATAAVRSARDRADILFTEGHHGEAQSQWSALEGAIVRVSADIDSDLVRSVMCRRMLADLIDGSQDDIAATLDDAPRDPELESALTEAARVLAHDPATLWALRDGLLELHDRPDVDADGRRLALAVANGLPLTNAYNLGADAATDALLSKVLLLKPLELRFGPAVDELCDSPDLMQATKDMQARIEAQMGFRIPWVQPAATPRLADRQVDVRVYGSRVESTVLEGTREIWIPQVMKVLEERVCAYLFRLVGVDDVALWLEQGWNTSTCDAPTWDPVDRLRLARVLRMLLREQVSVANRPIIVEAVRHPVGVDKGDESATLNTLRAIRRRLGPSALGIGQGAPWVSLPSELEDRVATGFTADAPVWELPRRQALQLVADLRAWLRAQPERPHAVTVADVRVRPFVWRLMAAERPTVRVLSQQELSWGGASP